MFLYKIYLFLFPTNFTREIGSILKKKQIFKKDKDLKILDIGCYIGNFSKVLNAELKSLDCKKSYYLIDPNFNINNKLKALNFKFKLYNLAIDNSDKIKTFYLNNFFQSSGSSLKTITVNDFFWNFSRKLMTLNFFKSYSKFNVQCQTLDNFTKNNKIKKINILKFDTEGNELNILLGAQKILKKTSIICFEILSKKNKFSKKFNKINDILKNNKFFLYKKKRIISVSFFSNLIAYDYIYLKKTDYQFILK
jgi:FkbM family methyltransferase